MFGQTMEQHLEEVGRRLFVKITEQLRLEIENVTEEDCLEYVKQVVFHRTFEGYMLEKQTIYEQIQTRIGLPLMPAPDEWDRKYNVDFYIEVKSKYIGIQVKPISYKDFDHMGSWKEWMHESHKAFEEKWGGKVFVVFSVRQGGRKVVANTEVFEEIEGEIRRILSS
ncbi:MAG: hypothetical protein KatS3mg026_1817 [Bacteroidia bacterium]|nr:MAG: hypothetical protein KatS3mg026_1817 [Bacteroidia bacterium]